MKFSVHFVRLIFASLIGIFLIGIPTASQAAPPDIESAYVCVNRAEQHLLTTVVRTSRNYSKVRLNSKVARVRNKDYSNWMTKKEYSSSLANRIGDRGILNVKAYSKRFGTDYMKTYFKYVWC